MVEIAQQLIAGAVERAGRLIIGAPYRRTVPKAFTAQVTTSASSAVITQFSADDFANDGRYPFVLEQILTHGANAAALAYNIAVIDRANGYNLFGGNNYPAAIYFQNGPIAGPDWASNHNFRTPIGFLSGDYRIDPNGGFLVYAQSGGTAIPAIVTLKGYWILEE